MLVLACALATTAQAFGNPGIKYFLHGAEQGRCIETLVFDLIQSKAVTDTAAVVKAAESALTKMAEEQRALGCAGDIAAQAIAAGADPDAVLRATAAGLK